MKKVYVSEETLMVLESMDNIDKDHVLFDSFYEKEVPKGFRVNVSGKARLYNNSGVFGNARVYGDAKLYGNTLVYGEARVYGHARLYDKAQVFDHAQVYGRARASGNVRIYGEVKVYGNAVATTGVISLVGLPYNITLTDNHIVIGCEQFEFETAKKLAERNIGIDEEEYKEMIIHKELLLSLIETKEKSKLGSE